MSLIAQRSARHIAGVAAVAAALLLGGWVGSAQAQAQTQMPDPPGRVARLAATSGQVWFYGPDSGDWINAARNRPLTSGDRLATDAGARAELDLGSTTLRLDSDTELELLQLDDNHVVLQLHRGSVAARLRDVQAVGEFELRTGEGRFRVQHTGRYRFDRVDASSRLSAYAGQALFEGPGGALTLYGGQRGDFWIDANGTAQYSITTPLSDAFSAWNDARDRAEDRDAAASYVSPEMTGAQELVRYGAWVQNADYGAVWFPSGVGSTWAPYSTGHWIWVRPWGWTWVDDAPWGFAPFHYGRWLRVRDRWGWSPGSRMTRPVYAPALVAWVGGPNVGASISAGGAAGRPVGWFPLAPREVYVPSYHASPRYVREINITHVTNVTQITNVVNNIDNGSYHRDFSNRKFPNAVTVVPASVMSSRQDVAPSAARLRGSAETRALLNDPARRPALIAPPVLSPVSPPVTPPVAPRGVPRVAPPVAPPGTALRAEPRIVPTPANRPEMRIPERGQATLPPARNPAEMAGQPEQRGANGPRAPIDERARSANRPGSDELRPMRRPDVAVPRPSRVEPPVLPRPEIQRPAVAEMRRPAGPELRRPEVRQAPRAEAPREAAREPADRPPQQR